MYIYIYKYMYIYICKYMYTYSSLFILHLYLHLYLHIHLHVYLCVCKYLNIELTLPVVVVPSPKVSNQFLVLQIFSSTLLHSCSNIHTKAKWHDLSFRLRLLPIGMVRSQLGPPPFCSMAWAEKPNKRQKHGGTAPFHGPIARLSHWESSGDISKHSELFYFDLPVVSASVAPGRAHLLDTI